MLNYRCSRPLPLLLPTPATLPPYPQQTTAGAKLTFQYVGVGGEKAQQVDAWPQFKGRRWSSEGSISEKKNHPIEYLWVGCSKLCWNRFSVPSNVNSCLSLSLCVPHLLSSGDRTNQFDVLPLLYVLYVLGKRRSRISFDWKLYSPNQLNEDFLIPYFLLRTSPTTLKQYNFKADDSFFP